MFPIRRSPTVVGSFLLAACLSAPVWREPTADELHELSLEELLEIPIETVRETSGALPSGAPPVATLSGRAQAVRAEGGE